MIPVGQMHSKPIGNGLGLCSLHEAAKKKKCIPEKPIAMSLAPQRTLYTAGLVDDYYLNLLDWGSTNVLAIAVRSRVYFLNTSNNSFSQLDTIGNELVTSLSWAPDGRHIVVGWNNSLVEIWDFTANRKLTTLRGGHRSRISLLSWNNNHILTTGAMDGYVINNGVRVREHVVETYRDHTTRFVA
ncbi:hypothetical protein Dsin_016732 [Dipteronia sinensis]|uniref:Anaphase-promoting complex subunit 4-like WD40 domain-containing protein n=1 Tax=Dipteronia sinensis TaxID=43782 RepID=A0AAE0AE99_9ROSI|nr:hypothetical protein Dsin_016732 [Dipteronia sinensis]